MRDSQTNAKDSGNAYPLSGFRYKEAPCSGLAASVAEGCSGERERAGEGCWAEWTKTLKDKGKPGTHQEKPQLGNKKSS